MVAQEISRGSEDGFPFPNLGMPELVHTGRGRRKRKRGCEKVFGRQ